MKRVTSIGAAITILFSVSCKENKQNATENSEKAQPEMEVAQTTETSFSNETVTALFSNYQDLRLALVESDAEQVQAIAAKIDKELTADQPALKILAAAMAQESSIEKQREQFSDFTEKSEPIVQGIFD